MNRTWFISGDDVGGLAEDFVQLYVSEKGKLLVFVVDGRDVDEQVSVPDGLTQADFEPGPHATKIAIMADFQKLVDEQFSDRPRTNNIQNWFDLGVKG